MATIDRLIKAESGGNPRARNPRSSAYGSGQFLKGTWLDMIRKHRPDLAQGNSEAAILEMRANPQLSRAMTEAYANQNSSFLQGKGYQATPGNIHLAHFAGPGGAYKVLSGDPNQTVLATLGADAVKANPFLRGMTNAGLIDWANKKQGGKAGSQAQEKTSVQSPEQKAAMSRTGFNPSDIKAGDDLTTSAQKIASTSGNALGALGGTLLAALGANQKSEAEAAKMAAGQETAQALQGATQGLEMADRLIASKDPAMRNAGIQMKAKILSQVQKPPQDKWSFSKSGTSLLNERTGEIRPVEGSEATKPLTEAQKAVDKAYSKEYVQWKQTGQADIAKNISQLDAVMGMFGNGQNLSGPIIGNIPDALLAFTEGGRKAVNARELVEEVVQRNLREVLGAQFAQKEGEQLIKRAYNPRLSEQENMQRLGRLITQIKTAAQNKAAMADYYEKNGTLRGYDGKRPSMSDFTGLFDDDKKEQGAAAKGQKMAVPQAGTIVDGLRCKGGNPRLESSWEFVGQKFAGGRSPTRNITNDPDVQNLQNYANPNSVDEMRRRSAAAQEWFRAQGGR